MTHQRTENFILHQKEQIKTLERKNTRMLNLLKMTHSWFRANYSYIEHDEETLKLSDDIEEIVIVEPKTEEKL